jgi:hypothetical protein
MDKELREKALSEIKSNALKSGYEISNEQAEFILNDHITKLENSMINGESPTEKKPSGLLKIT